jgi:hypothetical protein
MQDLDIWADQATLSESVHDVVELQFLVNGCDVATVAAASYTAVLPFAYFPSLKAAVLEFPLDVSLPLFLYARVLALFPIGRVNFIRASLPSSAQIISPLPATFTSAHEFLRELCLYPGSDTRSYTKLHYSSLTLRTNFR